MVARGGRPAARRRRAARRHRVAVAIVFCRGLLRSRRSPRGPVVSPTVVGGGCPEGPFLARGFGA
eukprot:11156832-Lingulodinium_polyedra.AAC.1